MLIHLHNNVVRPQLCSYFSPEISCSLTQGLDGFPFSSQNFYLRLLNPFNIFTVPILILYFYYISVFKLISSRVTPKLKKKLYSKIFKAKLCFTFYIIVQLFQNAAFVIRVTRVRKFINAPKLRTYTRFVPKVMSNNFFKVTSFIFDKPNTPP